MEQKEREKRVPIVALVNSNLVPVINRLSTEQPMYYGILHTYIHTHIHAEQHNHPNAQISIR